ncbi:RNA-directed DNA polymerase from mobile element jockey-like [Brachionus plicatilis]|uniref:RNA-directed DNA polymerase from mobile element jockey-like n=1 Tax=Brachionus plicatilis TaxID=10195 RepID=A0A3M7RHV3_BRAPC|nr:RNA-directed DNA polymerase from mobile element jockey-like [Brachionus plicatilis]
MPGILNLSIPCTLLLPDLTSNMPPQYGIPIDEQIDRSYQVRLAILNLTTLESRRSRGDLISHYKIANGLLGVNWLASTKLMSSISCHGPANAIRGHKKRLFVQLSNCPARTNFLNNRVASTWNNLASSTVNAPSLTASRPARKPPPPKPQRPTMAKLVRR